MKPLRSLAAALAFTISAAASFIPPSGDTVIERLPATATSPEMRRAREMARELRATPNDLALAGKVAREHIRHARATADPRHLGYAEAALRPWWNHDDAPAEVLVLRATVKQSLHNFTAARRDLELALAKDPVNAQAWLTLATIDTVQGRYDEARRACIQLTRLGETFSATVAAAAVASLTGQSQSAANQLESLLSRSATVPVEQRLWAVTQLAELHARAGRDSAAEERFRQALQLSATDPYLLGAYADFLLDQKRPGEVIRLLNDSDRNDGLLLRLAEAYSARGNSADLRELPKLVAELDARFDAARRRGDSIHQREEARFLLAFGKNPDRAVELATENWKLQCEPADARLLLECSLAAGNAARAAEVLEWMSGTRIEDKALSTLRDRLTTLAQAATATK